jgi:hypothetical protein
MAPDLRALGTDGVPVGDLAPFASRFSANILSTHKASQAWITSDPNGFGSAWQSHVEETEQDANHHE